MRRTTDIEPSWEVFDECRRCGAEKCEPCVSMRGIPKASGTMPYGRAAGPLANPHPGRKKLPK